MDYFHKIDDGAVITLFRGVYRQAHLYRRGDALYARHGAGFVRLHSKGGTSVPSLSWKEIDAGPGAAFSEGTFAVTYTAPVAVAAE